jgi:hypothetical protein
MAVLLYIGASILAHDSPGYLDGASVKWPPGYTKTQAASWREHHALAKRDEALVGDGNVAGITGLTTAQFQSGLPTGFDPKIWAENPNINNGLPYLINNPPPK